MIQTERFIYLIEGYKSNTISEQEEEELFELIRLPEYRILLEKTVDKSLVTEQTEGPSLSERGIAEMLKNIKEEAVVKPLPVHKVRLSGAGWYRYAAAILLILGVGYYFLLPGVKNDKPATITKTKTGDVAPGKNGATLTLADGSVIVLDSMGNGLVATQGNSRVVLDNDNLTYAAEKGSLVPVINTVTTSNGRQFHLRLPDGTDVWLNAASSITYPTVFSGPLREVTVTGEAYFEVVPMMPLINNGVSARAPFIVKVQSSSGADKGKVEVLGTHFNINAYDDEAVEKITLLEGSVKVSREATGNSRILAHGQQAQMSGLPGPLEGNITVINDADLEQAVAWKNGQFYFNGDDIQTIMRQVEKWYDVKVEFESDIKHSFVARISRDVNLSNLTRILELTDLVHFEIHGDTIKVSD